VDGAVVGKVLLGGVTGMRGGEAEVFQGAAEADEEFAVIGIDGA